MTIINQSTEYKDKEAAAIATFEARKGDDAFPHYDAMRQSKVAAGISPGDAAMVIGLDSGRQTSEKIPF